MFKGTKALIGYGLFAAVAIFVYVIYKLITLNWFMNVGFVTLLFYGGVALAVALGIYNVAINVFKKEKPTK
jgi:hypothetical protein